MDEMLGTIARVRRAMPRNPDVMAICDRLEKLLVGLVADRAELPRPATVFVAECPKCKERKEQVAQAVKDHRARRKRAAPIRLPEPAKS